MAEGDLLALDEAKRESLKIAFGDKVKDMVAIIEDLDKANWEAYNDKVKKQKAIFNRRNELVKTIPKFWLQAMTNLQVCNQFIDPIDRDALQHLTEITLDHDDADCRSFSASFHFAQDNPYFSDRILTKKFTVKSPPEGQPPSWDLDAPLATSAVAINWASPEHDLTTKKPRVAAADLEEFDRFEGSGSFFNWFGEETDELGVHDIVLELYANALEAYAGVIQLDDYDGEDDDDDEDDEDEDDEADPAAVVDLETGSDDGEPKRKRQKK